MSRRALIAVLVGVVLVVGAASVLLLVVLFARSAFVDDDIARPAEEAQLEGPVRPAPALAPQANEYQPFDVLEENGEFSGDMLNDPDVVANSIDPVGVAISAWGRREVYRFKSRMGGQLITCVGEFGRGGGSWGCGDGPVINGIGSMGGSTGDGQIDISNASIQDGDGAVWVTFTLNSGYSIVTEVRDGYGTAQWPARTGELAKVVAFDADLQVLWTDSADLR